MAFFFGQKRKWSEDQESTEAGPTTLSYPTYGLKVLSEPQDASCKGFDVVFVHGLRGSVEKTWLHQGTGAYWPRDFLSKDLPNCRILAFGYDADIVNFWNPASKNRIGNHAENLVGALAGEREITDTNGRSIIFIGHSLGGLVIQQALCHSKNSVEEHIQKVHECTAAIAFLGTPHFGADMAKWAAFGSQMTNTFKRSNSEIVDILKPGSEMLANIQGNFHSMLRIRDRSDKRIHITCFYEELPLPYIGEVVPINSAILPSYLSHGIHANHMDMTKFPSQDDMGYRSILRELLRWSKQLPTALPTPSATNSPALSAKDEQDLQSFYTCDYESSKLLVPSPVPGTCSWFLQHPKYNQWKMEGQFGVLWMSADPGCGKSVLTSFLIDELRGETTPPREVCYFFFSDNDEERNNSTSMIRSILHQLFTAQPHLFKYAVREKCTKGDRILDQFNTLWNIFLSSVADPACANIFFVIDGMDECDQSSRDQFISALHKASSDTTALASSSAALKVFVTSRPLESLKSRPFSPPTISWQAEEEMELINNDIALVVRARVGTLAARRQLSQDFQDRLVERLIGNADHTFLWVTLVLEMLERSTNASESTFNIIIDTLPSDLDGIYNRLLTQSSDTQMAQKVLHIVVAAFRPLTLREINIALAIQPDQETMEKVKRSLDPSIDYALREICGPFIRVNNSKVNLVHQTAKAFLVREPSHPSAQTDLWRHSLRPIDSHMILAEVCTMYLVLEDFGRDNILDHLRLSGSDESGSDESDSDSRPDSDMFWYVGDRTKARDERIMNKYIRRYDFLDYSARYWPAHYRQSGRPKSLRDRVYRLYNQFGNGCLFYNWFYVYSTFSSTWNYEHPELSSLMVASYFGFEELARELLEMDPTWIDMQDDKGWTALMYAALSGHEGIVTMLLEAGAGVDASGDSYTSLLRDHTALIGASAEGHSRVVQILIDHGAKIWTNTELALSTAVTMGNVDVIRVLLRNGCDIEEHDLEGQTPLHHACLNARLEAFQFLVQEGASIFAKDRRGRCALDMAAEAGAEEIVRLLLNKGMDVNSADYYGTTALDLAEEFGKYQVLHILLEHKAENFYYGYVPEPDPSEEKRHSGPSYTQRLQELRIYKDGFDVVRYLPWVLKNAVRRQLRDSPREEFILLPSDEFSTDLKGKIKEIEDVLEMERNCWHIKNNSYKTS